MQNFTSFNPTKLLFGKGGISKLGSHSKQLGSKAVIIIGKGSVKSNGILDSVTEQLKSAGTEFILYEGIKSNPIYEDVDACIKLAHEFQADQVIAIGGGSVIDSAKAVAAGFYHDGSVWDICSGKVRAKQALPILCVLTLAATGTEMNMFSVIQNIETGQKLGWGSDLVYPKVSFIDPEFTYSVPKTYTSYGVSDLIAHTFEQYFEPTSSPLSDYMATDIIKLAFEYGVKVTENPLDYDARANILWLSTMALNGSLSAGKLGGDWGVHGFEHSLSVLYDIPHGAGLSIIYPAWLKFYFTEIESKLDFLAERVLGEGKKANDFIATYEAFSKSIDSPTRLSEVDIKVEEADKIVENLIANKVSGGFFKQNEETYRKMLNLMW
ncbi:MAG: iron-containing alcohol dehydrogenase [Bacteroidota bacterium]